MTTPTGTITFQDVANEVNQFDSLVSPPLFLSGDLKQFTDDETDPTAMSELQGYTHAFPVDIVISTNTAGTYDIEQAAAAAGWNQSTPVVVSMLIETGVFVYGPGGASGADSGGSMHGGHGGNGGIAMRTGNFNGFLEEPIAMTLDGTIVGGGGGGGGGGGTDDFSGGSASGGNGGNGGTGGIGLLVDGVDQVTISGSGTLSGGGGGGGAGAGAAGNSTCHDGFLLGGGGAGGGEPFGGGGSSGTHRDNDAGTVLNGQGGQSGTLTNRGTGGSGASDSTSCRRYHPKDGFVGALINVTVSAGNGGHGGVDGSNGNNGGIGSASGAWIDNGSPGSRGTRGYYINGSSAVTFLSWTGSTNGRVT